MTNTNTFSKLEADIMKILTKNHGSYLSQYKIYDQLLDNNEIKDPIEKDNFKFRFLVVLRQMSSLFEGVSIIKKDDVIYTGFGIESKNEDKYYFEDEIKKDKEKNGEMPSEISVINFIIDEGMDKYFSRIDYKGNTLLHNLIIVGDLERIKKCFSKIEDIIDKKNNDGLTPIDLISDFKINNFITNHIFEKFKEQSMEYDFLLKKYNSLKKSSEQADSNIFYFLMFFVFLIQIIFMLYK
jgi:hypothetical protein